MTIAGPVNVPIYVSNMGQENTLMLVQNQFDPAIEGAPDVIAIQFDYAAGGNFRFSPANGRWSFDGPVACPQFYCNSGGTFVPGVSGAFTSQDGKTITVEGGLIVGIV
jgi:hypothetical protein